MSVSRAGRLRAAVIGGALAAALVAFEDSRLRQHGPVTLRLG
jgi:hypothetical protein